jgi:hypothetical protein
MTGLPGWLSQQDILRPLAPIMAVRGDTFRIRFYGEDTDGLTGKVTGVAIGEALVQRLPEYLDASEDAWKLPSASTAAGNLNNTFGRRYEVLQIRWLNQNEI